MSLHLLRLSTSECKSSAAAACLNLARNYDTLVRSHLAESMMQAVSSGNRYGMSFSAILDSQGVLGPHFVATHAHGLADDDTARRAERGVSVSHIPMRNLDFRSGVAAVQKMRATGIDVAVGSDGCTCADTFNMFEAARLACTLPPIQGPD